MRGVDPVWPPQSGRWGRLFADLSAAMAEAELAEMAAELPDRTRAEFGRLRLVDRLRPAVGREVGLTLSAGAPVHGTVIEVGADWLLLGGHGCREALVPMRAVEEVSGLGRESAEPGSEGRVTAKLDLRYALRRLARDRAPVTATLAGGGSLTGTCDRVGADFLELAEHAAGEPRRASAVQALRAVPLAALVVLRRQ